MRFVDAKDPAILRSRRRGSRTGKGGCPSTHILEQANDPATSRCRYPDVRFASRQYVGRGDRNRKGDPIRPKDSCLCRTQRIAPETVRRTCGTREATGRNTRKRQCDQRRVTERSASTAAEDHSFPPAVAFRRAADQQTGTARILASIPSISRPLQPSRTGTGGSGQLEGQSQGNGSPGRQTAGRIGVASGPVVRRQSSAVLVLRSHRIGS